MSEQFETTTEQMADAIVSMTYEEMMSVAKTLCDMNEGSARDLNDPREWAELLHSWAALEATNDAS